MDQYFREDGEEERFESRKRTSSFDSIGSDISDVYEITDNSMLFLDEEGEGEGVYGEGEALEEDNTESTRDYCESSFSYNPYIRTNGRRGGGNPINYKLTGVIHHLGTGCGGHYICFRKIKRENKEIWVRFNDIHTTEVQWKDVNTKDV